MLTLGHFRIESSGLHEGTQYKTCQKVILFLKHSGTTTCIAVTNAGQ